MALLDVDFTTRAGLLKITRWGALACYIMAGLAALSIVFALRNFPLGSPQSNFIIIFFSLKIVIFIAAGFRLQKGAGAVWGIVAAVIIALEIFGRLFLLSGSGGLMGFVELAVSTVSLIVLIQAIRAAWKLRDGAGLDAEDSDIFD